MRYVHLYIKAIFFKNSLIGVDDLYKNIVSKMSYNDKINYCESLIFRTKKDIKLCKCKIRKIKLIQLLEASIFELKKLEASSK